jgi:hypothetical protein
LNVEPPSYSKLVKRLEDEFSLRQAVDCQRRLYIEMQVPDVEAKLEEWTAYVATAPMAEAVAMVLGARELMYA